MSFTPKFDLDLVNSLIRVRDISGIYNANNNPTGWTSPNPALADITEAYITLIDSAGTSTTIDLYDSFPSTLTYEGYWYYDLQSLPAEEDLYKVKYTIKTATSTYYSAEQYYLIAPTTYAGLATMYAKIEDKLNDSDLLPYIQQVKLVNNLWKTLESLKELGDNNNSKRLITTIKRAFTFKVA